MSIYIEHHRKNNVSDALDVPSTVQKETSSVYDKNSQFACSGHANCFGTSSMSLVQRQRRCDGRTYRAETVEREDGGWRNEDAVVRQLERPVYTAQTDNPVPGHARTCTPSPQACMRLDLPHRANVAQSEAGVSSRGRTSCRSQLALQRS